MAVSYGRAVRPSIEADINQWVTVKVEDLSYGSPEEPIWYTPGEWKKVTIVEEAYVVVTGGNGTPGFQLVWEDENGVETVAATVEGYQTSGLQKNGTAWYSAQFVIDTANNGALGGKVLKVKQVTPTSGAGWAGTTSSEDVTEAIVQVFLCSKT